MAFTDDDEILQDFLIEAAEILEQLGNQLVELENSPQDTDLLNAVFRGFHTIKGGAGFLSITNLVEICHRAEDVFNTLRQGERVVDSALMDVILKAYDNVNSMFECVRGHEEPPPADPGLLRLLEQYAGAGEVSPPAPASDETPPQAEGGGATTTEPEQAGQAGDEITDDEFEALLDQLHGQGTHGGMPANSAAGPQTPTGDATANGGSAGDGAGDEITDDEFEALLDQLHGGRAPGQSDRDAGKDPDANPALAGAGGDSGQSRKLHDERSGPGRATAATGDREGVAASGDAEAGKSGRKEPAQPQAEATVRVDTKRLDDIMNLVGELVLVRNRLSTLESTSSDEAMAKAVSNLDLVTADLQASVMKTRMQPIKKVFGRFPRVVRDLARSLNKEVTLQLVGEETDLDKNLVEALADPLVHLVRNAVDHGVEMPDERERNGKERTGTVVLSAEQEGDHILLTISDDGGGMNAAKLREKVVEKGIMDQETAGRLSDQEAYQMIFMPGFSTKSEISDISGRGVGMDVVKTKITQLNGSIHIDSELGRGSQIHIKVPLTLAIMPTLMVNIADRIFALPLGSVVEIFHLDLTNTNVVDGQEVVLIRDNTLPIFYLRRWLIHGYRQDEHPEIGHVVVVNAGSRQVGFVVDKLLGQEEVVIKPLGMLLQGTPGLAGATITGDGRIALILDVPGLMAKYASKTQGYAHDGQCASG